MREPRLVRVTGFGPLFDEGAYEQDGHIRMDFGTDTPFLEEDAELDAGWRAPCGRECAPACGADSGRREGLRRDGAPVVERTGREPCAAAGGAAGREELSVRFTIERIRTLVLVAGVLLLVALAGFLWVGKWKNLLNRRDLPQRLGLNIQQEANGYTFVHAFGAHSQYKIHASKEVQLKDNRVLLHDVQIELYGQDGKDIDRIAGDTFEYDQKSGVATAQGPVEMLLTRPAAAPAAGSKGKNPPAAAAGASRQIHVKTSGVTFDQNSGMVTTAQRVDFSMTQGSGSAMGAQYDSQSGYLTLEQAVELTTYRGGDAVEIHAQHAEIDRSAQLCLLRAATADYRGGQAGAAQAKILFPHQMARRRGLTRRAASRWRPRRAAIWLRPRDGWTSMSTTSRAAGTWRAA